MSLTANLHLLLPEFLLAGLALLVFAIDLFLPANRKNLLAWFSVVAIAGIIIAGFLVQWGEDTALYKGLVIIDSYTLFFQTFFPRAWRGGHPRLHGIPEQAPSLPRRVLRLGHPVHPRHDGHGRIPRTADRLHLP